MQYSIKQSDITPGEIIQIEVYTPKYDKPILIQYFVNDDNDEIALGATILLKNQLLVVPELLEEEIALADEVVDVLVHNHAINSYLNLKIDPSNPNLFGRCKKCGEMTSAINPCCNSNIILNGVEINPAKFSQLREFPDGRMS